MDIERVLRMQHASASIASGTDMTFKRASPMTNSNPDSAPPEREVTGVLDAFILHRLPLRRFIARFMKNAADVDDVAQETFLRAYSVERDRPIAQPKSFIFRIAKHIALSRLTQKGRQITAYIEDIEGSRQIGAAGSAEDEVVAQETLGVHCEAVARLPSQCRQVYLLRKVHGLSHKEIATHLGIAVSTVEKHLVKGLDLCDRHVRKRAGEAATAVTQADSSAVVDQRDRA